MASEIKRYYDFGSFRFDAQKVSLQYEDEPVPLPPKSLQTLKTLLERHGETVSRDLLISEVWREAFVEDSNLTVAVSTLRKTLASYSGSEVLIQTVPREGYRLIADVSETVHISEQPIVIERHTYNQLSVEAEAGQRRRPVALARRGRRRIAVTLGLTVMITAIGLVVGWISSLEGREAIDGTVREIAVLPLRSAGGSTDDSALRLGIADSLISSLGQDPQLRVKSIGSVSRFLDSNEEPLFIARRLGVDQVIDGTYQIVNGSVRVNLRLLGLRAAARSGAGRSMALWAKYLICKTASPVPFRRLSVARTWRVCHSDLARRICPPM